MLRNIVKYIAGILLFVAGWTTGQILEDIAYFEFDNSLNVFDLVSVAVECVLAVFIVRAIGKKDEENRVEKDFYIQEYDKAHDVINAIEKQCATQNILSLDEINYSLSRCRKIIVKLWKQIVELHPGFEDKYKEKQNELQGSLNSLNRKLTDTKFYIGIQRIESLKINKGKIYLNGTIKPGIDDEISVLKSKLLEMKILVNKL